MDNRQTSVNVEDFSIHSPGDSFFVYFVKVLTITRNSSNLPSLLPAPASSSATRTGKTESKATNDNDGQALPANVSPGAGSVGDDLLQLISTSKPGKIRRPPNAFMLYAREYRKKVSREHPNETNKKISTLLGQGWRNLPPEQRRHYYEKATLLDKLHKEKYPQYVYNPKEARMRKQTRIRTKSMRRSVASAGECANEKNVASCSAGPSNTIPKGGGEGTDGASSRREEAAVRAHLERIRTNIAGNMVQTPPSWSQGSSSQEVDQPCTPDRSEDRYQPPDVPDRTFPLVGAMDDPPEHMLPDHRQRLRNIAATVSSRNARVVAGDAGCPGCSCADHEPDHTHAPNHQGVLQPNFAQNPPDPHPHQHAPSAMQGHATCGCADGYAYQNIHRYLHPYDPVPCMHQPIFSYPPYPYYLGRYDAADGVQQQQQQFCDCQHKVAPSAQSSTDARRPVPQAMCRNYRPGPLHCVPFPPPRASVFAPPMVPHATYFHEQLAQFRYGTAYAPIHGNMFPTRPPDRGNDATEAGDGVAELDESDSDTRGLTVQDELEDSPGISIDPCDESLSTAKSDDDLNDVGIRMESLQDDPAVNVVD